MKPLTILLLVIFSILQCSNETTFVYFDNNSDKTLRFIKLTPNGLDDETKKIEINNIPIGNTSSAYSIDRLGWSTDQVQNVAFTIGVRIATGTTTAETQITGPLTLTGMQPDANNFIIVEGTYPALTARVEVK